MAAAAASSAMAARSGRHPSPAGRPCPRTGGAPRGAIRWSLLAAALAVFLTNPAEAQVTYRATLAGNRELPAAGDPDGTGAAFITLDGSTLYYSIVVGSIAAPTVAHIHTGDAGVSGAVLVTLVADGSGFTDLGGGTYAAKGSVAVDAGTAQSIQDDPAGFYVNVHNADFPGGAVRGQLLGEGYSPTVLATDLRGGRETPAVGDGDGRGFVGLVVDGATLYYYLWAKNIAAPTASHVHAGVAGVAGSVVIPLVTSAAGFSDLGGGVFDAMGAATTSATTALQLLAEPQAFYVNIHNGDFPTGALRGQLALAETHVVFPIVSRAQGQAGSNWRTDLRIVNPSDLDATVRAAWFPTNTSGLGAPAKVVETTVVAGGQGVYDDVVGSLFGADGNGSAVLVSTAPISGSSRIYNDQRANPAVLGTFGQFAPGLSPAQARMAGAVPLLSNRPVQDGTDFRSNIGYYNPWGHAVQVTLTARKPDGTPLGSNSLSLAAHANLVTGIFNLVSAVPSGQRTQTDMFLSFTASDPVFIYGSVVDNKTNDAVLPLPVPYLFVPLAAVDNPPNGVITAPGGNLTVVIGKSIDFAGSASDPDGDPVTVTWDFGDGVSSPALTTSHTYLAAGTYPVTFTATDSHGHADPSPATLTVTVNPPSSTLSQLQTAIFTPICSPCHPPNPAGQPQDLTAGHTWTSIVGVTSFEQPSLKRVLPGDPDHSYLYLKVEGDPSISGARMPQGGPFLTSQQIDALRRWIAEGALNN